MTQKVQKSANVCSQALNNAFNQFLNCVKEWSLFEKNDWESTIDNLEREIEKQRNQQQQRERKKWLDNKEKMARQLKQKRIAFMQIAKKNNWKPILEWEQSGQDIFEMTSLGLNQQKLLTQIEVNVDLDIKSLQYIGALTNLQELSLYGHNITKISGIQSLTKLLILDLSSNQIEKIQNLQNLKLLKQLYLSNNKILKIQNLKKLTKLKKLYLWDNKIERIQNLQSQTNLQELYLSKNNIKKIPKFQIFIKLKKIVIQDNLIEDSKQNRTNIQQLKKRNVEISVKLSKQQKNKFDFLDNVIENVFEDNFQQAKSNLIARQDFNQYIQLQIQETALKMKLLQQSKDNSKIIKDFQLIRTFLESQTAKFKLLYRASENNFQVAKFHKKCNGISNTLVLVHTQFNKIIGGYTPLKWQSSKNDQWKSDTTSKSFLFSLTNKEKYTMVNAEYTICCNSNYGPIFGGGHDLLIFDKGNINDNSFTYFPVTYNNGKYTNGQESYQAFSGGGNGVFKIMEWQVFEVQFI